MLREIRIQNLAVVEDAVIPFDDGLNVLTGSTGAGKSIILTAVELLSGGRGRRSLLRRDTDRLVVEGTFTVPAGWEMRDRLGMETNEEELSMRRELTAEGRSRIWINGVLTTNTIARTAAFSLLELHGQHRQQELLDTANHINYLDAWGDYRALLGRVTTGTERYRRCALHLEGLLEEEKRHREQEEYLRFQLREIEELRLEPGLAEDLGKRIKRAGNIHRYLSVLGTCRTLLADEEDSVIGRLSQAEKALKELSILDDSWQNTVVELGEIRIAAQEISRGVERSLGEANDEPEDLEFLQERYAAIQRAGRKYGLDCDGLIERREELRKVLRSLEDGSDEIDEARTRLGRERDELVPLLGELTERRKKCARKLDRVVTEELRRLGMKGALFRTLVEGDEASAGPAGPAPGDLGWDRVVFGIRTNVGEQIHPLDEVASGGELSRITLVLKKLQVEERGIPTLIFDEIDTGLGADLGGVVAERLRELAQRYQVVCITHLPQVAALASRHIAVHKRVRGGRTAASAGTVSGEARVAEIARMLGGTGKLREKLAQELLQGTTRARSSAG